MIKTIIVVFIDANVTRVDHPNPVINMFNENHQKYDIYINTWRKGYLFDGICFAIDGCFSFPAILWLRWTSYVAFVVLKPTAIHDAKTEAIWVYKTPNRNK